MEVPIARATAPTIERPTDPSNVQEGTNPTEAKEEATQRAAHRTGPRSSADCRPRSNILLKTLRGIRRTEIRQNAYCPCVMPAGGRKRWKSSTEEALGLGLLVAAAMTVAIRGSLREDETENPPRVTALRTSDKDQNSPLNACHNVNQRKQQGAAMGVTGSHSPSLDHRGPRKGRSATTAEALDIWREIVRRLELEPRRGNVRGTAAPTLGAANRESTAWPGGVKTRPIILL